MMSFCSFAVTADEVLRRIVVVVVVGAVRERPDAIVGSRNQALSKSGEAFAISRIVAAHLWVSHDFVLNDH